MSNKYYIGGGKLQDVVNDTVLSTGEMRANASTGTFVISFYNDQDEPVTPTAGTVEHFVSTEKGQVMGCSSGDSPIDATACLVSPSVSTYVVPVYNGYIEQGHIKLVGITGAAKFSAYFWRT